MEFSNIRDSDMENRIEKTCFLVWTAQEHMALGRRLFSRVNTIRYVEIDITMEDLLDNLMLINL